MAKYEVWSKGRDVRTIKAYSVYGAFDVVRSYGRCYKDFRSKVAEHNANYGGGLELLTRTVMVTGGRDVRNQGVSEEEGKAIVARFRKAAEKAGFEKLGQYQSQA